MRFDGQRAGCASTGRTGYLATLSRTGIPDRQLPLKRRELGDLLAEELRRLDADQPYAEALVGRHRREGPGRPAADAHPDLAGPEQRAAAKAAPAREVRHGREEAGDEGDRPRP